MPFDFDLGVILYLALSWQASCNIVLCSMYVGSRSETLACTNTASGNSMATKTIISMDTANVCFTAWGSGILMG